MESIRCRRWTSGRIFFPRVGSRLCRKEKKTLNWTDRRGGQWAPPPAPKRFCCFSRPIFLGRTPASWTWESPHGKCPGFGQPWFNAELVPFDIELVWVGYGIELWREKSRSSFASKNQVPLKDNLCFAFISGGFELAALCFFDSPSWAHQFWHFPLVPFHFFSVFLRGVVLQDC